MFTHLVRSCLRPEYKFVSGPVVFQSKKFGVPFINRHCSDSSDSAYRKQLGGFEYKEEIEPFKSRWRKPYNEREEFWQSKFDLFTNKRFAAEVIFKETYVELETAQHKNISLNYEWLRENCRCALCYNEVTNQRNIHIFNVKADIHPTSHSLSGNSLAVQWSDGHKSQYDVNYLRSQSQSEVRPREVLWSGDVSKHVEYVTAKDVHSKEGATRLVRSLLQYGVGFVTNVEPKLKATEEVIQCVSSPQHTLFGAMWEFSDKMDHLDTAYTNQALDVHTDTTYFIEPAGLIIFHCTKRNCEGGETVLVDGFRAANEVKLEAPELYESLKTVNTEFQYIEKEHFLTCLSTIVHHTPHDQIKQIRYNLYDRSARLPLPANKCSLFYKSVRRLAAAINRAEDQWMLTMEPGTVVFINNWRVLHGRTAFTGERTVTGAYVSMGDLLSRARRLQLVY